VRNDRNTANLIFACLVHAAEDNPHNRIKPVHMGLLVVSNAVAVGHPCRERVRLGPPLAPDVHLAQDEVCRPDRVMVSRHGPTCRCAVDRVVTGVNGWELVDNGA
jgi:hypothetical protein